MSQNSSMLASVQVLDTNQGSWISIFPVAGLAEEI